LLIALALIQAFAFDLKTFTIPLSKSILVDPVNVPTGLKASIDLSVFREAANEWFDTII
jgi:hypothetical protein